MTSVLKPRKRSPNVCLRCSSDASKVEHRSDVVDFKGLTLEVQGLADTVCTSCGYRWETAGQQSDNLAILRNAFVEQRDLIRERDGLLTGTQIEQYLEDLNLTRGEAAAIFGGGPNAFAKYATGEVLQSVPMDRLLRVTHSFGHVAVKFLREGRYANTHMGAGWLAVVNVTYGPIPQLTVGTEPGATATAAKSTTFNFAPH